METYKGEASATAVASQGGLLVHGGILRFLGPFCNGGLFACSVFIPL